MIYRFIAVDNFHHRQFLQLPQSWLPQWRSPYLILNFRTLQNPTPFITSPYDFRYVLLPYINVIQISLRLMVPSYFKPLPLHPLPYPRNLGSTILSPIPTLQSSAVTDSKPICKPSIQVKTRDGEILLPGALSSISPVISARNLALRPICAAQSPALAPSQILWSG